MKENPSISQKEMADQLNISYSRVRYLIQVMKDASQIRREGGRKNGNWVVVE